MSSLLGLIERQLTYDVIKRWNSTFYMLKRFIEEKTSISAYLNEKSFKKNLAKAKITNNIDWDMQEQLMLVLEPFEAATRKLALDSLPTMAIVLPVITTLITSLEGGNVESTVITQIKQGLHCSLEERFKKAFDDKIVLLATILDPRWKNFTFLQSSSYQNHPKTAASLTKLNAFDAKLLAYIHLHDEHLLGMSSTRKSYESDSEHNVTSQNILDFLDMMVTTQPVTNSVGTDP
ncbi:unnamed protein product, partial [Adineta ricciae]